MSTDGINKEQLLLGQMYKQLFARVKELLIKPAKAWEGILAEPISTNDILKQFNLPLIAAYSLAVFLGQLFSYQELDFINALKFTAFSFSAYFFSLYIGYFVMLKMMPLLGMKEDKDLAFKMMAYSAVPMYLLGIVTALVPQAFFFFFLSVYSAFIVWEGLKVINSDPQKRVIQALAISALVLFLPMLLKKGLIYFSQYSL